MKNLIFFQIYLKFAFLSLFFGLFSQEILAQEMLKGKIEGLNNIKLGIIGYKGSNEYQKGECKTNKNGEFSFTPHKKLNNGIYTLYGENGFEVDVLYFGKMVELHTTKDRAFHTITFKNSQENSLYYSFHKKRNQYFKLLNYITQNAEKENISDSIVWKLIETADNNFVASTQQLLKKSKNSEFKKIIKALAYPTPLLQQHNKHLYESYKKSVFIQMLSDTSLLSGGLLFRTPLLNYRLNLLYNDLLIDEPAKTLRTISAKIYKTMKTPDEKAYFINFIKEYGKINEKASLLAWLSSQISSEELFSFLIPDLQKTISNIQRLEIGKILPNTNFADFKGDSIDLWPKNNKNRLIIFWSSECPHCTHLMAEINKNYNKITQKNLEIVAISIEKSTLNWAQFLMEKNYTWINLIDNKAYSNGLLDKYQILYTPKMYIINKNGKILAKPKDIEDIMNFSF